MWLRHQEMIIGRCCKSEAEHGARKAERSPRGRRRRPARRQLDGEGPDRGPDRRAGAGGHARRRAAQIRATLGICPEIRAYIPST